jgi:hypothetical protein
VTVVLAWIASLYSSKLILREI